MRNGPSGSGPRILEEFYACASCALRERHHRAMHRVFRPSALIGRMKCFLKLGLNGQRCWHITAIDTSVGFFGTPLVVLAPGSPLLKKELGIVDRALVVDFVDPLLADRPRGTA